MGHKTIAKHQVQSLITYTLEVHSLLFINICMLARLRFFLEQKRYGLRKATKIVKRSYMLSVKCSQV